MVSYRERRDITSKENTTMNKIIFLLAFASVLAVKADYIYWMVDSNPINVNDWDGTPVSSIWTEANLYYNDAQIGTLTKSDWEDLSAFDAYAYSEFTPTGTGTFMIELIGDKYGKTTGLEANLGQYIFSSPMSVPPAFAFGQGATYAVPEPTSGLLFVLGGMLLGLKRRRQKV